MDHDSARIDAGANVPFALLAVGLPSLVLREAMSVGALERCHTRAVVDSSKPRVRIENLQAEDWPGTARLSYAALLQLGKAWLA
jgi:hypothetical protein